MNGPLAFRALAGVRTRGARKSALPWALPLAALALWMALVVPSLGRSRMQEVDELTHGRTAQAAALHGQWFPLMLDGRPFYEKPPLLLWLAAATAKFSGQPYASWPYRIWTCLGAGLSLAMLVLIAAMLERPWAGLAGALGLALQGDFIYHARFFTFDTLFVACMLASLALALRAVRQGTPRAWLPAGVALGAAAAFKSWFVLSLVPAYACALWVRLPRPQRKRVAWSLAWPPALVLLSWIALYTLWNGWGFLREEWSVNFMNRIQGRHVTLDPDGHAAFYLKWVVRSAPALLPWALSAPLILLSGHPGLGPRPRPADAPARATAFARAWVGAFCLTWMAGMAAVRSETINYVVPLEAGLCLAAGLVMVGRVGAARAWLRCGLVAASVLAALRLWGPLWSLGAGAALGLAWMALGSRREAGPKARVWALALSLGLGLGLAGLLGREAEGLLMRPLDPNGPMAELLLAHPARYDGEPLWFVAEPTQAPYFYSSYRIRQVVSLPTKRPPEACLIKLKGAWIYYPAGGGAPSAVGSKP